MSSLNNLLNQCNKTRHGQVTGQFDKNLRQGVYHG